MTRRRDSATGGSGGDQISDGGSLSRRRFVQAVGAGALVGTVGARAASSQKATGGFVERDGTDLVVDGEQVYFHGANNFWITDSYRGEKPRIDSLFSMFEEMGIDFVRTFVACEGGDGEGSDCYMPEPYTHDEGGYETLDYIVAAAADHGIRLNLVLADNWDHNGGIAKYVDWTDGASVHGDFFVNEDVKDLYRWHVEETLTRENTVTGREYREEPSIASWELCNEPRIEGDAFGDGDNSYERRAQALEDWVAEMSAFVKDVDPNHLVSTGTEGFYTREDRTEWFYDEWTGQDFVRLHSIDTVDLCSFHWYPYHWNLPLEYGETWIAEHVRDAHEAIGKPAYLGEFNVNRDSGLETRNRVLTDWYEAMDAYDCDAASIWQIVLPEMHDHDGFQVYRSESGDVLGEYREAVTTKSTADLVTGGADPVLAPPTGVVANASGSCIELHWSTVSGASEYAVSLDGSRQATTSATSATVTGVGSDVEYEVGVAAIGPDGTETDVATRTVSTVGPETVDVPAWEYGTVYESGDRVVWNGIVWEAQWYTDEAEPRFESGYAWSFVRVLGNATCESGPGTEPPAPEPPTDCSEPIDGVVPTDPDGDGVYEDLNGNEEVDFDDVVTYFEHVDDPAVADRVECYDYNGNTGIDFADVVSLFNEI